MFDKKWFYIGVFSLVLFLIVFLTVNFKISYNFDITVFKLINESWSVPALNSFFSGAAIYGREYFWVPIVALMWILGSAFKNENAKKGALMLIIVFVAIIIIGLSFKAVYYRPRPFLNPVLSSVVHVLVPKDFDSSFPSGHALVVAGGAAIAFLFLRRRYSIPLIVEAAIVSYSRVYVGVHYPTDVLAGILLGVAIAFIIYSLVIKTKAFALLFKFIDDSYGTLLKTLRLAK
jgi:undecaprenyl-diphosphatase